MLIIALFLCVLRVSHCCEVIFENDQFFLESPNYPTDYPENVTCRYEFKSDGCSRFSVRFLEFEVEDSVGCVKDRLEVGNQDAVCGNKTGQTKVYESDSKGLVLKFLSDHFGSGKGFSLLVTKQPCDVMTTTVEDIDETTAHNFKPEEMRSRQPLVQCCKDVYNRKHFYLTSPKFPFANPSTDCTFRIAKTNENICRLRLTFTYFSWGIFEPSSGCSEGFLEIDGKKICGCNTGRELISSFREDQKILLLSANNFRNSKVDGFAIEVYQDECPEKYGRNLEMREAKLVDRKIYSNPTLTQEVFLFDYSENIEPEETTYTDTIDMNFESGLDDSSCDSWTLKDLARLNSDPIFMESLGCSSSSINETEDCVELREVRGYFTSPGYPYGYPGNLDMCYKFIKMDGYCAVRIFFQEFCLEFSQNCRNDYVLFENDYRFCWQSLMNTVSTFDLRSKPFERVMFRTNEFGSCRGFRGYYEQIPCPIQSYPSNTNESCSKRTQEDTFIISAQSPQQRCSFQVVKSNQNVCRLEFEILVFNLICGHEKLTIKDKTFCGRPTTNLLVFNFDTPTLQIKYEKLTQYSLQPGIRFILRGKQVSDGCYPSLTPQLPPPVKITQIDPRKNEITENPPETDIKLIVNKNDKEICDLVELAVHTLELENICQELMKDERIIECKLLDPVQKTEIVPLEGESSTAKIMYLHGMRC